MSLRDLYGIVVISAKTPRILLLRSSAVAAILREVR
jgi:hypothetical protein